MRKQSVVVNVCGHEATVTVGKHQSLGAVATDARWRTGYGEIPFDAWEIRDEDGRLLSAEWPVSRPLPAKVFVNRTPGIGA